MKNTLISKTHLLVFSLCCFSFNPLFSQFFDIDNITVTPNPLYGPGNVTVTVCGEFGYSGWEFDGANINVSGNNISIEINYNYFGIGITLADYVCVDYTISLSNPGIYNLTVINPAGDPPGNNPIPPPIIIAGYSLSQAVTCQDVQNSPPYGPIDITDYFSYPDIPHALVGLNVFGEYAARFEFYAPNGFYQDYTFCFGDFSSGYYNINANLPNIQRSLEYYGQWEVIISILPAPNCDPDIAQGMVVSTLNFTYECTCNTDYMPVCTPNGTEYPNACRAECEGVTDYEPCCICPAFYDPVCGSDGETYPNACEAECAGVTWTPGPCDPCFCIQEYDPVCGSDGVEYPNACFAQCAGVTYTPGLCENPCQCTQDYDPVCGDDGVTYPNSCFADCAGVSYTPGSCNNYCTLDAFITVQQNTSCGENNGSATVAASLGTPPYTFAWSNGQSGSTANNLAAGQYTVTVSDDYACELIETVNISASSTVNANPAMVSQATCGQANGSASASASGGTPPYIFSWSNGQAGASATGLAAQSYSVTVTDANGCAASANVSISGANSPNVTATMTSPANCGQADGSANASANGGAPPYIFSWSNGQAGASVTGLAAQAYSVTVTDGNNCSGTATVNITADNGPQITNVTTTEAGCNQNNGTATVTVSGGSSPYTYSWSNGDNTSMAQGLPPGSHTVTVEDSNGCEIMETVQVNANSAFPQADFSGTTSLLTVSFDNYSTNGDNYSWDFGDGNTSSALNPAHTYASSGTYDVILTVENGCGVDSVINSFTVQANDSLLTFVAGSGSGAIGDTISIPVTVRNFVDITSFQFTLHTISGEARIVGITPESLTNGLDYNEPGSAPGTYVLAWLANAPLTLPDQTVLFTVDVILEDGVDDCTPLFLDGSVIDIVAGSASNSEFAPQGINGAICELSTAEVSGFILKEDGTPLIGVEVSYGNGLYATTAMDGSYTLPALPVGDSLEIIPLSDDEPRNGINVVDLQKLREHILLVEELDSPYKRIAADVNNSGSINITDEYELRQLILLEIDDFTANSPWRFVEKAINSLIPTGRRRILFRRTLPSTFRATSPARTSLASKSATST